MWIKLLVGYQRVSGRVMSWVSSFAVFAWCLVGAERLHLAVWIEFLMAGILSSLVWVPTTYYLRQLGREDERQKGQAAAKVALSLVEQEELGRAKVVLRLESERACTVQPQ